VCCCAGLGVLAVLPHGRSHSKQVKALLLGEGPAFSPGRRLRRVVGLFYLEAVQASCLIPARTWHAKVVIPTGSGVRAGNAYFGLANCVRATSYQGTTATSEGGERGDGALSALQLAAMSTDVVDAGCCHKLQSYLLRRLVTPRTQGPC
jgi:hypothetical protein